MNSHTIALASRVAFARSRRHRTPVAAADLWWLRPAPLIVAVIVPLYLSFIFFDYENVVPIRYVPGANFAWGLLLLLALALGAALGSGKAHPFGDPAVAPLAPPMQISSALTAALLLFTVVAYVIWFGPLVDQPELVAQIFQGERDNLRDELSTLPGVTTLTQCGIAFVVLVTVKRFSGGEGAARWERAGVVLVILLAVLRAFLWSERLAVIEVLVPMGVTAAAFYRFRSAQGSRLATVLPIVGPILLYFVFTGTEYFRSWRFYQDYYDSIWQFTYERLMTYYAVATNSGIGLLEESRNWPQYTGRFVFDWAWTMPKLGHILNDTLGNVRNDFDSFLRGYGDLEFNNPSGLFPIVYDIGYFGSAMYFFLVGLAVGLARRSFALKRPFGVVFYPFCVLFILELLRFNYLASSRFVPAAGSLAVALFLHYQLQSSRKRPIDKSHSWRRPS